MEIFKKIKEIRNFLLIIAGGIIGNMVGSKVVRSIIDWESNNVPKKEE